MITVLILDDEQDALDCLKWELENLIPEHIAVHAFTSAEKATMFLSRTLVDAVFIDVEMPEMSGFDFLQQFPERKFAVIITTAYHEYALPAIKQQCLDFLQKPADSDSVRECIDKIKKFKKEHDLIDYIEEKLSRNARNEGQKKIIISTDGRMMFLKPDEVLYCESDGNYSTIFLENGKKIVVSTPLKQLEEKLTEDFFRVHHSFIINMNKVQEYLKSESYVVLTNHSRIPVSRQKKSSFLDQF
ncbi:LytR/AlgR family response regulator transcription factor [Chryseobacterium sp. MFBS3-17]|uniref:LytR/AlgR family response regulator transcription factor n=1 Tax=Chryseobacterium sp. MFBS3-17 TaxID=2886689 RepID=UPI001D0E71C0|nr:LytTR family DNA-binding domain-containing protein [Chryseobacterium sp. MFBS3-17]MCC2591737.1 LytTR family DNA-binding domain-containing protein [Chryseobacterium sp. MFBS3-17]